MNSCCFFEKKKSQYQSLLLCHLLPVSLRRGYHFSHILNSSTSCDSDLSLAPRVGLRCRRSLPPGHQVIGLEMSMYSQIGIEAMKLRSRVFRKLQGEAFSLFVDLELRRGRPGTWSCAKTQTFQRKKPTKRKTC